MRGAVGLAWFLTFLLAIGGLVSVFAQETVSSSDEGLGLRLKEELKAIIEEHKESIREAILEFKIKLSSFHENKTELISAYLEERAAMLEELRRQVEELRNSYLAGDINRIEFLARMTELRAQLKAAAKSSEKLGKLIQELHSELRDAVKEKVEKLREINDEFGKNVSETARQIGEEMRRNREKTPYIHGNITTVYTGGKGRGPPERGGDNYQGMVQNQTIGQQNQAIHGQGHAFGRENNTPSNILGNAENQHGRGNGPSNNDEGENSSRGRGRQNNQGNQ